MAKTLSPLLSASAHGKLARSLIYSKKKSGQLTRAMHYPKKEPSLKQWTRRHLIGLATARWQCMTDNERATWNTLTAASGLNLPGYQYFLKSTLADQETHSGMLLYLPLNESTGKYYYCHACDMIAGELLPSYPDDCPTRVLSFKTEYGNALDFDGTGWYSQINAIPKLVFSEQITLEVWCKLKDLSDGSSFILRNWEAGTDNRVFIFQLFNCFPHLYFSDDGINVSSIFWNFKLTTEWNHLVVTLGLDDKLRCFINAVELPETTNLTSFHTHSNNIHFGGTSTVSNFNGFLDELRIYNRALNVEEIKKHYQLLRLDKKRQPLLRL